jgi:hypothetical protein
MVSIWRRYISGVIKKRSIPSVTFSKSNYEAWSTDSQLPIDLGEESDAIKTRPLEC